MLFSSFKTTFVASMVGATLFIVGDAHAQLDPEVIRQQYRGTKLTPAELENVRPTTPNPWVSLRTNRGGVDWSHWKAKAHYRAIKRAAKNRKAKVRLLSRRGEQIIRVTRFGTLPWQADSVQIQGEFVLPPPSSVAPNPEDEGAIPLASETGLTDGNSIVVNGTIGDGAFGQAGTGSGDFDFYAIRGVRAGALITVDVDTALPFEPLDPAVAVYDEAGQLVAFNDDAEGTFDSFVSVEAPADGDYFVSVGTFGNPLLNDPFDSASGNGVDVTAFPVPNEGDYTLNIGLNNFDEKTIVFRARKGEVIGAAINGTQGRLSLGDRTGTERQGSETDVASVFNTGTPLPSGLAAVSHVVDTPGRFTLKVRGASSGAFTVDLGAALPPLRTGGRNEVQTIFIDFDGATVDLSESIFNGFPDPIIVTLSPLSAFLSGWGLTADDEDAVIDAVLERLEESLVQDIDELGRNRTFKIRILNSRDHDDPWGEPNVSRVIVGGSVAEFGIPTTGIAQSIDVGNFDTTETAFVLLDRLSGQTPHPNDLNAIPRAPGVSIIDVIGVGVGEITAHEAGHYLGCWHTDAFNPVPNIMDQGVNLRFSLFGVGDDGIFGTDDDNNAQFVVDEFTPEEEFTGFEDTRNTIAFGSTRRRWFGY